METSTKLKSIFDYGVGFIDVASHFTLPLIKYFRDLDMFFSVP